MSLIDSKPKRNNFHEQKQKGVCTTSVCYEPKRIELGLSARSSYLLKYCSLGNIINRQRHDLDKWFIKLSLFPKGLYM